MIKQHTNGIFQQNTWIYINDITNESVIVDPGDELEELFQLIHDSNVTHIFITHGHVDHIQGLEMIKEAYPDALIVAHKFAEETLPDPHKNLSHLMGVEVIAPRPDITYEEESGTIQAAGQNWTMIHTPGHAIDHTIFCCREDNTIFGGDLLFEQGGMGRTDFPGCDPIAMRVSIAKILSAPEESLVFPGHGETFHISEARSFFDTLNF